MPPSGGGVKGLGCPTAGPFDRPLDLEVALTERDLYFPSTLLLRGPPWGSPLGGTLLDLSLRPGGAPAPPFGCLDLPLELASCFPLFRRSGPPCLDCSGVSVVFD